jgi:hypothetical protein
MRLRTLFLVLPIAAGLFLSGCATKPQLPVELGTASTFQGQRIGVAMTKLPKPEVHLPGAGCLLCIIAATAMNTGLSKHTDTLTAEDLPALKDSVAQALRKKGAQVQVIAEPLDLKTLASSTPTSPNVAPVNFAPLKQKYGIDKVLVIEINAFGFERTYASYIPTGDPKALVRGRSYLVNLGSNAYEWYLPLDVIKSADGKWDEPGQYPGLTNAYYQAIELGKDRILKPLSN